LIFRAWQEMLELTPYCRVGLSKRWIRLLDGYQIFLRHDISRDGAINILAIRYRIFSKLPSKLVNGSVSVYSILLVGRPLGQVIWIIVYHHRNYCSADYI
jgi:hypothetical protein